MTNESDTKLRTVQEVALEISVQHYKQGSCAHEINEPILREWAEAIMEAVLEQQHRCHKPWDELRRELGLER